MGGTQVVAEACQVKSLVESGSTSCGAVTWGGQLRLMKTTHHDWVAAPRHAERKLPGATREIANFVKISVILPLRDYVEA